MTKKLVYIGGDASFVAALESHFEADRLHVSVSGTNAPLQPLWSKLVVFVIDCDIVNDPFKTINQVRDLNPCSASVLVSSYCDKALTRLSMARLHGAESFHWKPITDWDRLLASVRGAFARLTAWHELVLRFEREHLVARQAGFNTLPPTAVNFPVSQNLQAESDVCYTEVPHPIAGMAVPVV